MRLLRRFGCLLAVVLLIGGSGQHAYSQCCNWTGSTVHSGRHVGYARTVAPGYTQRVCGSACHYHAPLYKRVLVPLCPKLAQLSYEDVESGRGKLVGKFMAAQAKRMGITITPLSNFEAELFGPQVNVEIFLEQYPSMLCAFNSELVVNDESTFTSCRNHARKWMELTANGKSQDLMLSEHLYCPNCCR